MKVHAAISALLLSSCVLSPAEAGPAADALATCLTDNSTGKDRKMLAQWVFAAMSAHPEIRSMSAVSQATRDELDQSMAKLGTRLLTENCPKEAKLAVDKESLAAIEAAFGALGKLAMQELMADPGVGASFMNYTKYLDRSKFEAVLSGK